MNSILQYSGGLITTFCGGFGIYKGVKDLKNNDKTSGITKMTFGTLLIGAGIAILSYNQEILPITLCDKDALHPSCSKILKVVKDALEKGEFKITTEEHKNEFFPALNASLYDTGLLKCRAIGNSLKCQVTLNQDAPYSTELLKSIWEPSQHAFDAFKSIQACNTFKRLEIITWNPTSSNETIALDQMKLQQLRGSLA